MEYRLRPITFGDIPTLAAWMVNVPLWQRYGMTTERAASGFESGLSRGDWLICADGDTPACGFAWVMPRGAFGRSAYLRLIGVQTAGAGLGSLLLNEAERVAADTSKDMVLLASDFNTTAHGFYIRHGYSQIGAIPDYVLPGVSELIFRKRLK